MWTMFALVNKGSGKVVSFLMVFDPNLAQRSLDVVGINVCLVVNSDAE